MAKKSTLTLVHPPSTSPSPPRELGKHGLSLWKRVHGEYNISDAGGATTLSGTIQTDGSQTYLGAVTAPSVTLVALGGLTATDPANNFGSVTLTGGAINVRDVGAIDLPAVTVGAGQTLAIDSGSTVTLHGNVTTTADAGGQLFGEDSARTRNDFYGGQIGLGASRRVGAYSVQVRGLVALGVTVSVVSGTGAAASAGLDAPSSGGN